MAIAVYGKKIIEDNEKIVYIYGLSKNDLNGKIEIIKPLLNDQHLKYNVLQNVGFVLLIMCTIELFYKKNNYFPDTISRES